MIGFIQLSFTEVSCLLFDDIDETGSQRVNGTDNHWVFRGDGCVLLQQLNDVHGVVRWQ